jgi:hypothetical protein
VSELGVSVKLNPNGWATVDVVVPVCVVEAAEVVVTLVVTLGL